MDQTSTDPDRIAMPPPPTPPPIEDRDQLPSSPITPTRQPRSSSITPSRRPRSISAASTSRGSNISSSGFSESVRSELQRTSEGHCWACPTWPTQGCHVFGLRDTQVTLWAHLGLVNYSTGSASNGISLCASCHGHFDRDNDPGLAIIPVDLDYFIEFEKEDRQRREAGGKPPGRRVPTRWMYESHLEATGRRLAGYVPVFLKNYTPPLTRESMDPKHWHGAPAAALRRAIMALGSGRLEILGEEVTTKLQTLRRLYFTPIAGAPQINLREELVEPQADPRQYQDPPNPNANYPRSNLDALSSSQDSPSDHNEDVQRGGHKRRASSGGEYGSRKLAKWSSDEAIEGHWVQGPETTSQDAIHLYTQLLSHA